MEIVLYNVLSNALKNTPSGGNVIVSITEDVDKGQFCIDVKDTGVGISTKDKPRIFERFFQSNEHNRRNYAGSGIGLAHAQSLVELLHGTISFESEEGVGTQFFVTLPMINEEAKEKFESLTHLEQYLDFIPDNFSDKETNVLEKKHPFTLLIVEDNGDLRHFVASELEDTYNILQAEDGVKGLELAKKYSPTVILSDVMMPNMDGIELCRHIKLNEETSHIAVVLLTSKTTEEAQIEGFDTGADAYIPKPFSTDVLKHRLSAIIRNRETFKEKFQKEIKINPMIISNSDADVKFMEKILALIEENISNPEFNVEALAKAYGVSRVYLGKKVKALTGETTIQFQRNVRLKHAAELLANKAFTISEVAWEVGYNDLNTFRQRFKEKFEMSPSEYRNRSIEKARLSEGNN